MRCRARADRHRLLAQPHKESLFMAGGQCTKSTYGQAERSYGARGCCVLLLHVLEINIHMGGIMCN